MVASYGHYITAVVCPSVANQVNIKSFEAIASSFPLAHSYNNCTISWHESEKRWACLKFESHEGNKQAACHCQGWKISEKEYKRQIGGFYQGVGYEG